MLDIRIFYCIILPVAERAARKPNMPGWSSGLGRCPLTAVTGVRLPYQVPQKKRCTRIAFFVVKIKESNPERAKSVKKDPGGSFLAFRLGGYVCNRRGWQV